MKIGVMNNPARAVYDELISIGKASYDFVDLTIEGPNAMTLDTEKARAIMEDYGLVILGHTDPCLPYAYPIREVREACLKELERCAKIFASLGAKIMNIHPCYACPPRMRPDLVALNIDALRPIVEMAGAHGMTVVFENFKAPFDTVSTFEVLLEAVRGLKAHLDFGHIHMGGDDQDTFCRELAGEIKHVHFSDNRSTGDHHMPLGVGSIDWNRAVESLKRIGYDDTITLEVFCDDHRVQFQYLDVSRKHLQEIWNS